MELLTRKRPQDLRISSLNQRKFLVEIRSGANIVAGNFGNQGPLKKLMNGASHMVNWEADTLVTQEG